MVDAVLRARASGSRLKVRGSGHSFTDAACTDGVLVSLDRYDRVLSVDVPGRTVTVQPGITLRTLSTVLADHGLALENLGDVAYQTVAGATQTGTHGTGLGYGSLSTQIVSLRLVAADGSPHTLSRDDDPGLFRAACLGLGALGVITEVTLRCQDAFDLLAVEEPRELDDLLPSLDQLAETEEFFEFYWFPHTTRTLTKRNTRTTQPRSKQAPWKTFRDDVLLYNVAFGAVCRAGRLKPSLIPSMSRQATRTIGRTRVVDRSDRIFTSPRYVRFAEMEYALPRQAAAEAMGRLRSMIDDSGLRISFPVEVRFSAAEDLLLSPAYGRQSCWIAVHMYRGSDYRTYFSKVEGIMLSLGGRPHWGKIHGLDRNRLKPLYPAWDDFAAARDRYDPDRLFANSYLDRVLGP